MTFDYETFRRLRERNEREIGEKFIAEMNKHLRPEQREMLTHDIVACPACGQKNRVPVLIVEGKRPICGKCKGAL